MNVLEALQGRYSLRDFADMEIEEEKLQKILEAGRLAPTASNQQRTKVVVVRDPALREGMAEACSGQAFVGKAPAVLVVCADNDRVMRCGQSARTVDCCIALSFMCAEAASLGVQGCWIGSFDPEKVRALLHIPEDYIIAAVFPLGYAAKDNGQRRVKKSMEDFCCWNQFEG